MNKVNDLKKKLWVGLSKDCSISRMTSTIEWNANEMHVQSFPVCDSSISATCSLYFRTFRVENRIRVMKKPCFT